MLIQYKYKIFINSKLNFKPKFFYENRLFEYCKPDPKSLLKDEI
jgi:hypothetical protein